MTVGDYLRVPYLVTIQSVELPDGTWRRHVEHPQLPGAIAEEESIEDALNRLEVLRVEIILAMLAEGEEPPIGDYLLGDTVSRQRVERAGLGSRVVPLWGQDAESLVQA